MSVKRLFWVAVLLAGIGAAAGLLVLRSTSSASPSSGTSEAAATWGARERPAPAFRLHDENGKPLSLAAYRGKPVVVTFMDPVCRDYCPLEAKVLNDAIASTPGAAVVAVNVNLQDARPAQLRHAATKWRWDDRWHWAVGSGAELRPVWKRYGVTVLVTKRELVHTEAAYVIDGAGYERALFLWPFKATSVQQALRALG